MTGTKPRLEEYIRAHLTPLLRSQGFQGSGRTYRRVAPDAVHVVNVQGARFGGSFFINLAAQPIAIPDATGRATDRKKIQEHQCEFRTRLSDGDKSQWVHESQPDHMRQAVEDAAAAILLRGDEFFGLFHGAESLLQSYSSIDLENGNPPLVQFCFGSAVRVAFVFAQLRLAQGRLAEAKDFAAFALKDAQPDFVGYEALIEIANAA